VGLLAGALMLGPSVAQAQDKASAEELFQLGKAAMAKNDLTKACAYFQGSLNADFALGTLLNLGICLEQAGKLASAWGAFRSLEDKARQAGPNQAERARYAHDRAELLRPRLSRVRIVLSPEAKAMNGLTVKIDGVVAQPELFEAGVPVDPGTRGVVVSAPEHDDWTQTVTVEGEKQKLDLTVPGLKLSPVMPKPAAPPPPPPPSSTRTVGFVVGGIGAASMVAGGIFGLLALGASKDSKCDGCIEGSDELSDAKGAYSRANAFAWVTNIAIGVGVVGLGVGTALVLTSGSGAKKKTARLVVSPNGLGVGGTL
jgi:hypothetical protein